LFKEGDIEKERCPMMKMCKKVMYKNVARRENRENMPK
jgi:hypothetical protein